MFFRQQKRTERRKKETDINRLMNGRAERTERRLLGTETEIQRTNGRKKRRQGLDKTREKKENMKADNTKVQVRAERAVMVVVAVHSARRAGVKASVYGVVRRGRGERKTSEN